MLEYFLRGTKSWVCHSTKVIKEWSHEKRFTNDLKIKITCFCTSRDNCSLDNFQLKIAPHQGVLEQKITPSYFK